MKPTPRIEVHPNSLDTRRQFLTSTLATTVALAAGCTGLRGGRDWPIGCFNRAWAKWPSDVGFAGIRAAGFHLMGLISIHNDNPFALPTATSESLAVVRKKVAAHGLKANITALRYEEIAPDEEIEQSVLAQLDHSQALGVSYVMTFGANRAENYDRYLRMMRRAAGWAADRKLKLVLKPHGGISAAADDIQRCLDAVAHPNFKIWYDAGNILHYTGKDPAKELKPIARHVTGFCAKDCLGLRGEVMIQFGNGRVNFPEVFGVLKSAGFRGPVMIEGIKQGATPAETNDNATANREYLERILQEV